ncbi:MAG TPA: AAA family ATPase [Candidatus Anaerobiospirillum pullistercoris]|uniref:AAA family ATPase n=1 Tax=Candidatus Anaerobiospirillum pullistercoris TaxID=2838452 RepID=A0A9D2B0X2_9GAMM|nr:AAA family ATPase [Candidatus Anaerobiospirillum pullistercoris]
MDVEELASLESQKKFCAELVDLVSKENFVLLAGERGSGRTVLCEQVVNETDSKMRAVFIPCHKDMQLQRLRELFLQQLLPNMEFDTNLNLPDSLLKVHIPHNNKILVVVDDADMVVSSFFNELMALYEQFLGQGRFSFILVGQPLWAEEKMQQAELHSKTHVTLKQIPPLNLQESMVLARHVFALNNTMQIYKALQQRLPERLTGAKGNISRIIAITEKLMKEPTVPQTSQDVGRKNKLQINKTKKKSSSVGIFVTIVCIFIVVLCLVPVFFGGSFFSDDEGTGTQAQVANENSLLLDEGNNSFDESTALDDGLLPPTVSGGIDAETTERQTEHSVTLSGEELERIEGGANGSGYPRGVDRSVAQNAAAQQVATLRREDNRNHFRPDAHAQEMTTVDVSATQQQALLAQRQAAAAAAALERQQQELAAQQAAAQQAAQRQQQAAAQQAAQANNSQNRQDLDRAAQDKIAADRARAQAAQQQQANNQQPARSQQQQQRQQQTAAQQATPPRPTLRAGQVINLADEQRQQRAAAQRQQQAQRPATASRPTGRAVEGNINEVRAIPDSHFTVQIVSSSSRANITAAAQGLSGRYWILETRYNNRPWYILLSGDYASRDAAQAAARQIPQSVSQGATPFAKRIMDIKPEIR